MIANLYSYVKLLPLKGEAEYSTTSVGGEVVFVDGGVDHCFLFSGEQQKECYLRMVDSIFGIYKDTVCNGEVRNATLDDISKILNHTNVIDGFHYRIKEIEEHNDIIKGGLPNFVEFYYWYVSNKGKQK